MVRSSTGPPLTPRLLHKHTHTVLCCCCCCGSYRCCGPIAASKHDQLFSNTDIQPFVLCQETRYSFVLKERVYIPRPLRDEDVGEGKRLSRWTAHSRCGAPYGGPPTVSTNLPLTALPRYALSLYLSPHINSAHPLTATPARLHIRTRFIYSSIHTGTTYTERDRKKKPLHGHTFPSTCTTCVQRYTYTHASHIVHHSSRW